MTAKGIMTAKAGTNIEGRRATRAGRYPPGYEPSALTWRPG